MPYDERLVAPMRAEVTDMGVRELRTPEEVDRVLGDAPGTVLVFVNSVCGCAAGNARPALRQALKHGTVPQSTVSVFAGQDTQATQRARQYFAQYQPSSPSFALLREGEPVAMVHRHQIEGQPPEAVARRLTDIFDKFCAAEVG